jgi:hypothetical protein
VTSADINRAMIAEKSIGEPTDAGSGVTSSADSHAGARRANCASKPIAAADFGTDKIAVFAKSLGNAEI